MGTVCTFGRMGARMKDIGRMVNSTVRVFTNKLMLKNAVVVGMTVNEWNG